MVSTTRTHQTGSTPFVILKCRSFKVNAVRYIQVPSVIHRFSAGFDGVTMEFTTEYRHTTTQTREEELARVRETNRKIKWWEEMLKYMVGSVVVTASSVLGYCLWKIFRHKLRVRKARRAQEAYAEAGYTYPHPTSSGLTAPEDLPPPPTPPPRPQVPDQVSITSSEDPQFDHLRSARTEQETAFVEAAEQARQENTPTPPQQVTTPMESFQTPSPPSTGTEHAETPSTSGGDTSVTSWAAQQVRSLAAMVGYPTGTPVDPSLTGVGIVHDQPVPQAADQVRQGKRLVKKKPPTAPKPQVSRSRSRGRPRGGSSPARGQRSQGSSPSPARRQAGAAARLASPRRSLRRRAKKS